MEPSPPQPADPNDLSQVRIDVLRRAVEVYLGLAYASCPLPEAVRRRLEWAADGQAGTAPGTDARQLLSCPPFERVGSSSSATPQIVALRLGNVRYPHMKLQIQPWPSAAGFILSVNTHDQVLGIDPDSADAVAFRALQVENQRLKEQIEQAWDQEGLPTFLRYLRDYIESRSDPAGTPLATDSDPESRPR